MNATAPNTLSSGVLNLSTSKLTQGTLYFAAFFTNDGYTEIAPTVPFYFGPTPTLSATKPAYNVGDTVTINYSGSLGASQDWIGIYNVGVTPGGGITSTQWSYIPQTAKTTGSLSFSGLAAGYYYAEYFVNNGYTAIGNKVAFSVGSNIASTIVSSTAQTYGQNFSVTFANGPGNLKDYVGIFLADGTPGGSGPDDKLQSYQYFGGAANGSVTFSSPLPAGRYQVGLYINDSYTSASPATYFTIVDPRPFVVATQWLDKKTLQLSWPGETTLNYKVESSTDLLNWNSVQSVTATDGNIQLLSVPADPTTAAKQFFRVTNIGD